MDWNRAIAINRTALTRIVAALIAMAGGIALGQMPQPLYRAVSRLLRPAEAAVRRLIVIAARGLTVETLPVRAMPGLVLATNGSGRVSFQLFDPRKRFAPPRRKYSKLQPRIHCYGSLFLGRPAEPSAPTPDATIAGQRLGRRLAAIKSALENLPRQARRLIRAQARRAKVDRLRFQLPLRPGLPPGYRKELEDDVDYVLQECHALAQEALRQDSS